MVSQMFMKISVQEFICTIKRKGVIIVAKIVGRTFPKQAGGDKAGKPEKTAKQGNGDKAPQK